MVNVVNDSKFLQETMVFRLGMDVLPSQKNDLHEISKENEKVFGEKNTLIFVVAIAKRSNKHTT